MQELAVVAEITSFAGHEIFAELTIHLTIASAQFGEIRIPFSSIGSILARWIALFGVRVRVSPDQSPFLDGGAGVERLGELAVEVRAGVAIAAAGLPIVAYFVVAVAGDGGGGGATRAQAVVDWLAAVAIRDLH